MKPPSFFDTATILCQSGRGGNGSQSFRREKYIPFGGPDGGSGGQGGSIVFRAKQNLNTLTHYRFNKEFKAEDATQGEGQNKHGRNGKDKILDVPIGTLIKEILDDGSSHLVADLDRDGDTYVAIPGGKGGLGNKSIVTPNYQAPKFAQLGEPSQSAEFELELKLVADVGIIGFPNAGKSTLISVISNAKPKIAHYPFTTITPNLGVVKRRHKDFVVIDVPGLIENAHQGKGLGDHFLRHIERTRVIIHLVEILDAEADDIISRIQKIQNELESYAPMLASKPQVIAVSKIDTVPEEFLSEIKSNQTLKKAVAKISQFPLYFISASAHIGLDELLDSTQHLIEITPRQLPTNQKPRKLYRPLLSNPDHFTVFKEDGMFLVRGKKAEMIAITIPQNNEEAFQWMRDRLIRLGVVKELEKMGIITGDIVQIGDLQFEWL